MTIRFRISGGVALAIVLIITASAPAFGQELSRWALGRPSLMIDMPSDPSAGGVAWAEASPYSFFPNSWSAEGGGVRVEVARVYSNKVPTNLLAELAPKMSLSGSPQSSPQISGRDVASLQTGSRIAFAIGSDGGVLGGASWIVTATLKDPAARTLLDNILLSIKVEREGGRHWAIRSLGRTFLATELPFELAQMPPGRDDQSIIRYESSFDGMDVTATSQVASEGMVFDPEKSIQDLIAGESTRPGVKDFRSTREKFKLDDKTGEMLTMDFKRGSRNYRIYKIAFIDKRSSVVAGMIIDPTRTDHQDITQRILRGFKTTVNPVYGWKTYAIGSDGLYVDLPVAPSPPKQQNAVTIYNSDTPLAMTEIRELEVSYPSAHDPDFSAKQYFEFQTAMSPNQKFQLQGIDKLLIDGLEARLVRATWQNGKDTNQRQILTIYGYKKQWIVDTLAAKDTALYMERVIQSVRVKIGTPPTAVRQSFGAMGVSFIVGNKRLETKVTENAADPDFAREETATTRLDKNILAVYEMVFKAQAPPITDERGKVFVDGFLRGLGQASGLQLSAYQRDSFAINIDGINGRHIIYDVTASNMKSGSKIQLDFVMLGQDKKFWTATVVTNYEGGMAAREGRAQILNSLRVGM